MKNQIVIQAFVLLGLLTSTASAKNAPTSIHTQWT